MSAPRFADLLPISVSTEPCSVPSPSGAALAAVAGARDVLALLFADALRTGVLLAADGRSPRFVGRWVRRQLADAAARAPGLFAEGSPYRQMAVGALRAAADVGFEARLAFEARQRGDQPSACAPRGFVHATLPPRPRWVRDQVSFLLEALGAHCQIEGLVPVADADLLGARNETPEEALNQIDDDGVHRIRSTFFRDPETGRLYQLSIVRAGQDVTIYRRYAGATEQVPILGGYSVTELEFLQRAFSTMLGEFAPIGPGSPRAG